MKKITYSIVLLWSVLFCSCQKEDTLTTVPDGGVQLNFSGAQANLSAEELSNIVETFHVLIYDETGNFVRHSEYEKSEKCLSGQTSYRTVYFRLSFQHQIGFNQRYSGR